MGDHPSIQTLCDVGSLPNLNYVCAFKWHCLGRPKGGSIFLEGNYDSLSLLET